MIYDIRISSDRRTLVDIDRFELAPGKITLLLGESGIGKTLISRTIFGLLPGTELQITINGQNYSDYLRTDTCRQIQSQGFFVFQEPSSHLNPMMTLSDQLNEGSIHDASTNGKILHELFPALTQSELDHLLDVYPKPYRPSGGEKQRMLIAMAFKKMALLNDPDAVFIFDEPTGNLDNVYRNIFLKMLIGVHHKFPITVLLITHDYSMISEVLDKYPGMHAHVKFSELRISDDRQVQFSFSTDAYINWLNSLKPARKTVAKKAAILKLDHEIGVFGRRLSISADKENLIPGIMEIFPGDAVYLKAGSGIGKTTVAKIIMGLQRATRFSMEIKGRRFDQDTPPALWKEHLWAKQISMVFQHADEALNLNGKVKDIFRGLPLKQRSDPDFITATLASVFDQDLPPSFLDMPVAFLSGGQKQRLNLIRAMILDPELLILDEPFNGLDFTTMQRILDLIQDRQKRGRSFMIISHNEEIIDRFIPPDRVYYLHWKRSERI